jgi:hypothetical protein
MVLSLPVIALAIIARRIDHHRSETILLCLRYRRTGQTPDRGGRDYLFFL